MKALREGTGVDHHGSSIIDMKEWQGPETRSHLQRGYRATRHLKGLGGPIGHRGGGEKRA